MIFLNAKSGRRRTGERCVKSSLRLSAFFYWTSSKTLNRQTWLDINNGFFVEVEVEVEILTVCYTKKMGDGEVDEEDMGRVEEGDRPPKKRFAYQINFLYSKKNIFFSERRMSKNPLYLKKKKHPWHKYRDIERSHRWQFETGLSLGPSVDCTHRECPF